MEKCAYSVEYGKLNNVLVDCTKKLVGEILTVLDTTALEPVPKSAVKSLVKQAIWRFCNNMKRELELEETDLGGEIKENG